jgi:hypothetical protein
MSLSVKILTGSFFAEQGKPHWELGDRFANKKGNTVLVFPLILLGYR